jgi:hypothetical protein
VPARIPICPRARARSSRSDAAISQTSDAAGAANAAETHRRSSFSDRCIHPQIAHARRNGTIRWCRENTATATVAALAANWSGER